MELDKFDNIFYMSRVDVPTEKRVKRWGLSMEELMSDPTGKLFDRINRTQFIPLANSQALFCRNRFTRIHELFKKGVQPREYKILAGGQRSQAQFSSTNI